MSETLYIALDLFHPASYTPRNDGSRPAEYAAADERYTHDRDWFYLIVQPFLIRFGGADDSPTLTDYLRSWDNARLATPGSVRLLDDQVVAAIQGHAAAAPISVIPVPLPVGASLAL